jgi:hypothetical protein
MMYEWIIYILTLLISVSVVGGAANQGFLNSSLTRGFAGVTTQIVSSNFLIGYTNFESFLRACLEGKVGISGYAFILALGVLLIVWINNIIEYRQAIV